VLCGVTPHRTVLFTAATTGTLNLTEYVMFIIAENKVLRRILGPKKDEIMGGWRKLQQ
jgi:hypothetical protein